MDATRTIKTISDRINALENGMYIYLHPVDQTAIAHFGTYSSAGFIGKDAEQVAFKFSSILEFWFTKVGNVNLWLPRQMDKDSTPTFYDRNQLLNESIKLYIESEEIKIGMGLHDNTNYESVERILRGNHSF